MKKIVLFLSAAMFFSTTVVAQAYEGSIEYNKKKESAFVIEYTYPAEAVENAISQKMEKLGYRGKEEKGIFNKDKGFRVFKNASIAEISSNTMDYILKVERKSRKEKDVTLLYLIINKEGANAVTTFDAYDMGQAKSFLNNLLPEVEAANLELQIRDQEETVSKAEKKLRSLKDDQSDLEKKLKRNQEDQTMTEKDIENQKQALENLKLKRKAS
jgi:hypothetical protein